MKRKLCMMVIIVLITVSHATAQKILMKITDVTDPAGEEVRALEFQINAASSFTSGAGGAVGKAIPGNLMIKKTQGPSTSILFNRIVAGKVTPTVVFEYYNAANTLYYTITLTTAYLTQLYWLSPECPTCLKLEHQIGFVFKQIKTVDVASGQTTTWDVTTNTVN